MLWVRAWLQRRRYRSFFNTLVTELPRDEDLQEYKNYMRMSKDMFDMLLDFKVKPISFKLMCFCLYIIDLDSKDVLIG